VKTILRPKISLEGTNAERLLITPVPGDDGLRMWETDTNVLYEAQDGSWHGVGGGIGDTGDAGNKGDTGEAIGVGSQGDTGAQGDTGDVGLKGDTGDAAGVGSQGDTGVQGDTGIAGSQGDTGITGAKGDTGTAGTQGDTGVTGLQGDTGAGAGTVRMFKAYGAAGEGFPSPGHLYMGGFYYAQGFSHGGSHLSPSISWEFSNSSHAAHAFVVCDGPGTVNTGQVGLRVTGTSISDAGTRTTSDTEVLTTDITTLSADHYLETSKRWLGPVTFGLYVVSGSPTNYVLSFNYGLCLYDNWDGSDIDLQSVTAHGMAENAETQLEIELIHHNTTGWTFVSSGFDPVQSARVLASLTGDHSTDDNCAAKTNFAWRHTGLSQSIAGSGSEGFLTRAKYGVNKGIHHITVHVGVDI
jgi:hypothetical protein